MDDAQVSVGQQIYATNCTTCHGQIGERPPLPGTPSHAEDGHTWHHDDRQLFGWILDGPPVRTIMPTFRGVLSDQEVLAVLAYMKSEWPGEIRDIQTRQTAEYERQLREQDRLE